MKRVAILILICLFLPAVLFAQGQTGRIVGRVLDPGGAVIPGAEIKAIEQDTGVAYRAVSSDAGVYALSFVPPGRYRLEASFTGFKKYERENLVMATNEVISLDIALEIGGLTETVKVTETAPLLQSATSDVAQFIEGKTVADMPINGRRALQLIPLLAGGIMAAYAEDGKPNFALNGGRAKTQMFWLDGGENQNMRYGQAAIEIDPPIETVRELQVLQNTYAAEFGGSAGGVIVSTTKSGTNRLHGSLFEFFRNDKLNALNFNAAQKAPLRYNLFGGTVGGPIRKDKTHYFVGYEGTRRSTGAVDVLTVPTLEQRGGDFSRTTNAAGALIRIFDPATNRIVGGRNVRDQFTNNIIPANRLDPVAVKLMPFYPLPNRPPSNSAGANNFVGNYVGLFTRDNVTGKVDHVFSDKNRFYFRLVYNPDPSSFTTVHPNPISDTRVGNPIRREMNFLFSDTITVRPNMVTDFRVTLGHRRGRNNTPGLDSNAVELLGLKNVPSGAFPAFIVSGIAQLGTTSQDRIQAPIRHQQYVNGWTWVHGSHVFKFGGEFRRSTNRDLNRPSISGVFSFATQPTALEGTANTGFALASLFAGFPTSFSLQNQEELYRYGYYMAGFLQDDWKITRHLTLNIGVRWETDTPMMDAKNRMNSFDPAAINPVSGTPGVVRFAGVDGWPSSPYNTDWNNFGPRFGFAWQPWGNRKTVVRGGFGVYFAAPFDRGVLTSAALGFESSLNLSTPDNGVTAPFLLRDGPSSVALSGQPLTPAFGAVRVGANPTTSVEFFERSRPTGYSQQFNLGIQRELPRGIVLDVSYLGNLSRKLGVASVNINQIRPESVDAIRPAGVFRQAYRPFPQFNGVTNLIPPFGVIDYHSAIVKAEKRFAQGLNFLCTYTWSKNLGNGDNVGGDFGTSQQYSNYYNFRADKGPDALDFRHRFTWSSVWEVPLGRNRRWLRSGVLSQVVGGWGVGAIAIMQTGGPFTVTTQTNTTNVFSAGAQRANVLRDPNLPGSQKSVARWFDTLAFEAPAAFTFGNAGRGIVRADGRINFDFSIVKNLSLSESKFLQLRAELFNAFNHFDFALPGTSLGSPAFGVVSGGTDPRQVQLGLRFVF